MSIFNQMIRGDMGTYPVPEAYSKEAAMNIAQYRPRTFKETLADQIAFHERKIAELKAVHDSLTPELEKFVEALQKLG